MHSEVKVFVSRMRLEHFAAFDCGRVLEFGSYDVNGTPRDFFQNAKEYVGVDWRPGPRVDVVSIAHEYRGKPDGWFDFALSTEMFEHDPHWRLSIARMIALVRVGGAMIVTCAGPHREEHHNDTAPDGSYRNIDVLDLATSVLRATRWDSVYCEDDSRAKDVRLFACGKR